MKAQMYIDAVTKLPLLAVESEKLSDGSEVWQLSWNGHVIPCFSEKHADEAFDQVVTAIRSATGEEVKTL